MALFEGPWIRAICSHDPPSTRGFSLRELKHDAGGTRSPPGIVFERPYNCHRRYLKGHGLELSAPTVTYRHEDSRYKSSRMMSPTSPLRAHYDFFQDVMAPRCLLRRPRIDTRLPA